MENVNSLDQDADDDGFTNIEEYLDGSDPDDITDYPYTSSEAEDSTFLMACLATIAMVSIFGIAIYANARRYKKRRGPREWAPPPQQYQQPPQEQPLPAQELPPIQEPPGQEYPPPPPPPGV